jgi:hypothetical protein
VEDRYEQLLKRLDQGEREIRALRFQSRLSRWLALTVVAGGITFLATRPAATQGRLYSALYAGGSTVNGPLTVVDDAGRPILQVGTSALGRGMVLYDAAGQMLCGVGITAQGRGLVVYDAQQKLIAGLGEGRSTDGTAAGRGLTVLDPAERVIGSLGSGQNGSNQGRGLTINDGTGAPVAGLGVWPQRPDRGQLVLTDRNASPVFAQPELP